MVNEEKIGKRTKRGCKKLMGFEKSKKHPEN